MNFPTKSKTRGRVERWLRKARRDGLPLPAPEYIAKVIADGERDEEEKRDHRLNVMRAQSERFLGCMSVTEVARDLRIPRATLFQFLAGESWLFREHDAWRAHERAVIDGFVVERGPASIRWCQITPDGQVEIARRLALNRDPGTKE